MALSLLLFALDDAACCPAHQAHKVLVLLCNKFTQELYVKPVVSLVK